MILPLPPGCVAFTRLRRIWPLNPHAYMAGTGHLRLGLNMAVLVRAATVGYGSICPCTGRNGHVQTASAGSGHIWPFCTQLDVSPGYCQFPPVPAIYARPLPLKAHTREVQQIFCGFSDHIQRVFSFAMAADGARITNLSNELLSEIDKVRICVRLVQIDT
jgi:hypothetical protein